MADLLAGLTDEQLRHPTLCEGCTVHDVAAHLVSYLRCGRAKLYAGIAATAADLDAFNRWLTRRVATRATPVLVDQLRRWSASRISIPRSGYDPVLTDIVLDDLDVRLPLGIRRDPPEAGLSVAFGHLARQPSPGFAMYDRVLLAIGGRLPALDTVDGEGVAILRDRLERAPRPGPVRRLGLIVDVLRHPQPRERRSRDAVG
jgi:uncharacterized protein (TIGR03083 family)